MPFDTPIKLGPNTFYFHGDLWTAEEIKERWGVDAEHECQRTARGHNPQPANA
jgi:hypothetical protein